MKELREYIVDDAIKYGILEAVILYWLKVCTKEADSEGDESFIHDGRYFFRCSIKELKDRFGEASESQIRHALKHLVEKRAIVEGNYNESKYDHTKWYAVKWNELKDWGSIRA